MPGAAGLPVIVVGGGIAGVACARRLHDAGQPVRLLERGPALGGRMASYTERIDGRPHVVDVGAPYFTVTGPAFADVVAGWQAAGLVRPWTDTFSLAKPDGQGPTGSTTGPLRWSSTRGMNRLVEALAVGLDVQLGAEAVLLEQDDRAGVPLKLNGAPAAAVVLALPDREAVWLLPPELADELEVSGRPWAPAYTVWAGFEERWWPDFDAIFVSDSPVLSLIVDSGRSRGDGTAAVLLAHVTGPVAERDFRDGSHPTLWALEELAEVFGHHPHVLTWNRIRHWSQASSRQTHPEPFRLTDRLVGVCGDAWGPKSRVEQAWASGNGLAEVLLNRLAVP